MYMTMMMVPFTRVIAQNTAADAGSAAWVAPILAGIFFVAEIFALRYIVKHNDGKSLAEICRDVLGNALGSTVNILYVLWLLMLSGYYLRQFGERMATTVFFDTSSAAFIAVMLACVGFALRYGPAAIIRTGSIFFYALATVFILSAVTMIPQMELENLLPISFLDTAGIMKAVFDMISVFGYIIMLPVYFGDIDSFGFAEHALGSTVFNALTGVVAVAVPIGVFSAPVVAEMIFPYFSAAKTIRVLESVERVEAVVIAFFILADFIIIAFTLMSAQKMLCDTLRSGKVTPYYNMLLLGTFVISLYLDTNSLRLNEMSSSFVIPVNFVFGVGVPLILFSVCVIKNIRKGRSLKI